MCLVSWEGLSNNWGGDSSDSLRLSSLNILGRMLRANVAKIYVSEVLNIDYGTRLWFTVGVPDLEVEAVLALRCDFPFVEIWLVIESVDTREKFRLKILSVFKDYSTKLIDKSNPCKVFNLFASSFFPRLCSNSQIMTFIKLSLRDFFAYFHI